MRSAHPTNKAAQAQGLCRFTVPGSFEADATHAEQQKNNAKS